ncbi:MAG: outer membrane beta-barrel protein [Bacteroidetes bacterium]|jgi:hypothetical protein|nr:outer membrane beta-barrel protein [Bacteroidota bacterium]
MKKILLLVSSTLLLANSFFAQESDDDKKFRLGLKVAAQPTWFSSKDNNTTRSSTGFGFGFGLAMEFRLSKTAYFVTGIGGDFESGGIKYKYEPLAVTPYAVGYVLNGSNEIKELKDGTTATDLVQAGDVQYNGLYERKIKTTHVTIPLALKMMTKEIGGFKYFGVFGGEIGVRIKARATDKYTSSTVYGANVSNGPGTNTNININKDGSLIPIRVGMNVGLGAEYRLAGSTSLFLSINYFRSFTNLMKKESEYMAYDSKYYPSGNDYTFSHVKQNLLMNAIRINIGVLF